MKLLEKAFKLGREISQTEHYREMKSSEEKLQADENGQELIRNFQALKNIYERKAMAGEEITEANIKELEELEKKAMENDNVRLYYIASRRFQELVDSVNTKIHEGIGR